MKMLKRQISNFRSGLTASITLVFQSSQPVIIRWFRLAPGLNMEASEVPNMLPMEGGTCGVFLFKLTYNTVIIFIKSVKSNFSGIYYICIGIAHVECNFVMLSKRYCTARISFRRLQLRYSNSTVATKACLMGGMDTETADGGTINMTLVTRFSTWVLIG